MLTLMYRDFALEDQTLIHVVILLLVSAFSASLRVSSNVSLAVRGNLDSSGAGKLFVSKVVFFEISSAEQVIKCIKI